MREDYQSLDLDKVKQEIAGFASIDEAKTFIMNEDVSFNPLQIRNNLLLTREAIEILKEGHVLSFDGIHCCDDLLDKAEKGIFLSGQECVRLLSFHRHCERIRKIFTYFPSDLSLRDYSDSITLSKKVFDRIEATLDNSGEVREDASEELKRLNREISSLEKDLLSRAQRFISHNAASLQEQVYYIRNGRYTFLVRNSDKNKFQGYTYGTTSSGLATYVEPGSFVEADNRKIELEEEREDEIARILMELTYLISDVSYAYKKNFSSLLSLCVIFAKAVYGMERHGVIAELSEDTLLLNKVRHPLIDPEKVVENTYSLSPKYRGIVISGSNTGGKTVGLKVMGLSVVMSYLGIPVLSEEAMIPLYDNVFVDIDDNQSISSSLSTFSAHITNINHILEEATSRSLILIDELISGTDPKEAQAISLAIIDRIKEIGSRFIVTTHFDDIKNYALEDEEIMLSSVGFDMEALRPTYHYYENSVGSSNALEIASRYFSDPAIIEKASSYLKGRESKEEILLHKLEKELTAAEKTRKKYEENERKNKELQEELQKKLDSFDKEKKHLSRKYEEELAAYILKIEQQAEEKLASLNTKEDKKVVEEIRELIEEKVPEIREEKLEVGDAVRIGENEQIGTLLEISGNRAVVDLRGIKVKTKLSELTKMPKQVKKKKRENRQMSHRPSVPKEINLVGKRVEEALDELEPYLDAAFASHMSGVKIIHGIGTGALREAVRSRLKKLSFVAKYDNGDFYDGGSAVTIVEFKR
ncbi:MAG: Smr/MutS family protein [Erysipelotrichaceae bacterium]|nr:Smr/MutS family protein [Erysipelotrichaceae bacterium]